MIRAILAFLLLALGLPAAEFTNLYTGLQLGVSDTLHVPSAEAPLVVTWTPTNLASCSGWWRFDYAITNANGQITNLPDYTPNGYYLTNFTTGACPLISNNWLNGHAIGVFDGTDDYLRSSAFTNPVPHEIWYVIWLRHSGTTSGATIQDSMRTAGRAEASLVLSGTSNYFNLFATASLDLPGEARTNRWMVLMLQFGPSLNSRLNTNQVTMGYGDAGTAGMSGFTLGSRYGLDAGRFESMDVAEIIAYNSTNSAANRGSNWLYLTNKYGAATF